MSTKREFLECVLDEGIQISKDTADASGMAMEGDVFDGIDRKVLLDKMVSVCSMSVEEMVTVDTFLKSDLYAQYTATINAMTNEIFKYVLSQMSTKEEQIH